jgi:two-component system OmpR family response regulator
MESREARNASCAEHNPTAQGLRILIVEDHADTADSTAMLLRLAGHDARIANSGEDALQMAPDYEPDVVLLDIGLPGLNGLEVAQALREQARTRRPFLIAVTGFGQDDDRKRSSEAGIDLHLTKPVDNEPLEKILVRFQQLFDTCDADCGEGESSPVYGVAGRPGPARAR